MTATATATAGQTWKNTIATPSTTAFSGVTRRDQSEPPASHNGISSAP